MHATEFIENLELLAHGDNTPFAETLAALVAVLTAGDHKAVIELSLSLSGPGSERARDAFDRLMDVLCVEPVQIRGIAPQGWRAYAALVVQAQPVGAVLSQFKNPEAIARMLARRAQLNKSDIRVLPFLLPTDVVFHQSPIDTFNFCKRVRAHAELATSPSERSPELDRLMSMTPQQPLVNAWASDDERPTFAESVVMVLVRGSHEQTTEEFNCLQRLDGGEISFECEYDMAGTTDQPLVLTHQMVAFGSAWKVFKSSLHMAQAFALGSLIRAVAEQFDVPLESIATTFAQVEEADGSGPTMRIAIQRDKSALLAGVVQTDLEEPQQFLIAARTLLATLGVERMHVNHDLFSSAQVDKAGQMHVYVNEAGWYIPPEMYKNFE